MNINVGELLAHRAALRPERVGLICEGHSYTWRELNRRANRAGHALEALGARPGDRVAILARNGVEYFDLFFGLGKTGVIFIPLNHRLAIPELASVIEDCGPRVLIYSSEFEPAVDELRRRDLLFRPVQIGEKGLGENYEALLKKASDREPISEAKNDDALAILYSFWARGRPRGVMLSHENFFWSSVTTMATLTNLGQTMLLALPLFHIGGLGWLPSLVHLGGRSVVMPRFEPDRFLDLCASEEVTAFGVVPTMLHLLRDSRQFGRLDLSRLRAILSYGQSPPIELIDSYHRAGVMVRNLYGLTETAGPAMVIDAENATKKAGSCGLPFFHTTVKLVDDHGADVMRGEPGEVLIQGDHVMKGYWNQPDATADVIKDGWLLTGDIARRDEDGYFYIIDRKKEIVISGGENINPDQVEAVILEHPGVEDVAVIGYPTPIWGEAVMACVVKKEGADLSPEKLAGWLKGKIANYKVPQRIEFFDAIPRTAAGKMEKWRLRGIG